MYQKIIDLLSEVSRIVIMFGHNAGSGTNLESNLRFSDGTITKKERNHFGIKFTSGNEDSDTLHWTVYSSFFPEDGKKFLVQDFMSYDDLETFSFKIIENLGPAGTRWFKRHVMKKGGKDNVR